MRVDYCDVCGVEITSERTRTITLVVTGGRDSGVGPLHLCSAKCELVVRNAFAEAAPGPGRSEDGRVGKG